MDKCGIGDQQLMKLTEVLANSRHIVTRIDLMINDLTISSVSDLFTRAERSFSSIEEVWLLYNNLADFPVGLYNCCLNITTLGLSYNPLGVTGIQSLSLAIEFGRLPNLNSLLLNDTLTEDADINGALLTVLFSAIGSGCSFIECIFISRNVLGVPGMCAVREGMGRLVSNRTVNINMSQGTADCEIIMRALCVSDNQYQYSKTALDISNNIIHITDLPKIVSTIAVERLTIRFCISFHEECPSSPSFSSLSMSTQSYNTLTKLDLSDNDFSGRAVVLAQCIRACHKSLVELTTSSCLLSLRDVLSTISTLSSWGVCCEALEKWDLHENDCIKEQLPEIVPNIPNIFPLLGDIRAANDPEPGTLGHQLKDHLSFNSRKNILRRAAARETSQDIANRLWMIIVPPPPDENNIVMMMMPSGHARRIFFRLWNELLEAMIVQAIISTTDNAMEPTEQRVPQTTAVVGFSADQEPSDDATVDNLMISGQDLTKAQLSADNQSHQSPDVDCSVVESGKDSLPLLRTNEPVPLPGNIIGEPQPTNYGHSYSPASLERSSQCLGEALLSDELTQHILDRELETLTDPIRFGVKLNIPQHQLEIIRRDNPLDTNGQKLTVFGFIAKNYKSLGISWSSIARALAEMGYNDLAADIQQKFCQD